MTKQQRIPAMCPMLEGQAGGMVGARRRPSTFAKRPEFHSSCPTRQEVSEEHGRNQQDVSV